MLKFLVFADMHYKKRMYAATVEHLQQIMERAAAEQVDFVIHAGDFCNDYLGSPEIVTSWLHNPQGLPVYGIFGNHELEAEDHSIELIKPLLCNRPVCWADEQAGYWYQDIKGFRLIGLDTNYSYNPEKQMWEHNETGHWGPPKGNLYPESLGSRQLAWLDAVLEGAQDQNLKAIVFSHSAMADLWESSPDAKKVRQLFKKHGGTVLLSVGGHLHTDHFAVIDKVAYFDVNAVINGDWYPMQEHHYTDMHTFEFTDYDAQGNPTGTTPMKLSELKQGMNTWFFEKPLSAVLTVEESGTITVEGSRSAWMYGIAPTRQADGVKNQIENRTVKL